MSTKKKLGGLKTKGRWHYAGQEGQEVVSQAETQIFETHKHCNENRTAGVECALVTLHTQYWRNRTDQLAEQVWAIWVGSPHSAPQWGIPPFCSPVTGAAIAASEWTVAHSSGPVETTPQHPSTHSFTFYSTPPALSVSLSTLSH